MNSVFKPTQEEISPLLKLYSTGSFMDLVTECRLMIKKYPNYPKLYNILGVAYHGLEKFDIAIECYQEALKIDLSYAEAHNNMGNTLKVKGDFDTAVESFKKAIFYKPNFAEAFNNMGASLQSKGDYSLAISKFQKAIEIKNDFYDAYVNKGNALRLFGDLSNSIQSFKAAIKLEPNSSDAYFSIGLSLRESENIDEAIKSFEKTIKIEPCHYEAYNYLGNLLKSIGQTKKAISIFKKALKYDETLFELHRHLAFARTYDGSEAHIEKLLSFATLPNLSDYDYININFALGKIFDDIRNFKRAFYFFAEGNRLKNKELNYSISDDIYLFNSIKDTFRRKSVKELAFNNVKHFDGRIPIFIVGMPRSGTTLVEQILASHSEIYGAGELNFFGKSVEVNKLFDKNLSEDSLSKCRSFYFDNLHKLNFKETYISDKMPLNFRWCGFILKAIPEAKIIHVRRDRMATCFSLFKSFFSSFGNKYAYDLNDIKGYYDLYLDLMCFWEEKFPERIYELNYEILTENPEKEIRKLVTYTGLGWDDNCMHFYRNDRAVFTLSKTQVREKIFRGSSRNWKNYETFLKDLMV